MCFIYYSIYSLHSDVSHRHTHTERYAHISMKKGNSCQATIHKNPWKESRENAAIYLSKARKTSQLVQLFCTNSCCCCSSSSVAYVDVCSILDFILFFVLFFCKNLSVRNEIKTFHSKHASLGHSIRQKPFHSNQFRLGTVWSYQFQKSYISSSTSKEREKNVHRNFKRTTKSIRIIRNIHLTQ